MRGEGRGKLDLALEDEEALASQEEMSHGSDDLQGTGWTRAAMGL